MLGLAPIWAMVAGLAMFMAFYTMIEMTALSDNIQLLLTVVWIGVALFACVELASDYKKQKSKPNPLDDFNDFHRKVRKTTRKRRERF